MLAALAAGLLSFGLPWDKPAPPPGKAALVLTRPAPPDPPPPGSMIDLPDESELPAKWRWTRDADGKRDPGLATLDASGSAQFSRDQLYALGEKLRGRSVALIDLRQEPHVFLNGAAVSWGPPDIVGITRSANEAVRTEIAWAKHLADAKFATLTQYAPGALADVTAWRPISLRLDIREAFTESQLALHARWGYLRIAMPDTVAPRDEDVDRLVDFVRGLDPDSTPWLHFHCDTGGNRTTLFLVLYDMMRNYVRASRPDIVKRQFRLGGIDLLAGSHRAERTEFLERFYSYCWQNGPHFRRSWSSWNRAQVDR